MSVVSPGLEMGSMQAWQRRNIKHKNQIFSLCFRLRCVLFSWRRKRRKLDGSRNRRKKKEIFHSFRLRFRRAYACVSTFSQWHKSVTLPLALLFLTSRKPGEHIWMDGGQRAASRVQVFQQHPGPVSQVQRIRHFGAWVSHYTAVKIPGKPGLCNFKNIFYIHIRVGSVYKFSKLVFSGCIY